MRFSRLHSRLAVIGLVLAQGCTLQKDRLVGRFRTAYDPIGGDFIDLDEKLFGMKACLTGLLEPGKFDEALGFKILLEEEHDPSLIPVLLVHGQMTGPRSMELVGGSLDRSRFEPWYAYYAAGHPIELLGMQLRESLAMMARHEGVGSVAVVSFSLGGLVVRSALRHHGDGVVMPGIPVFIAASTPWGGSDRVGKWSWSPDAPESWKDMKPGSEFLEHLFDDPLPGGTRLHVLAGSGGNSLVLHGEDDTVVEVEALLTPAVLDEATTVMFYDYLDHFDMVSAPEPLGRINSLLAAEPGLDG